MSTFFGGFVIVFTKGWLLTLVCRWPSYTGEKQVVANYNKSLEQAYKSSVHEGLATGLGLGLVMFMMFCSYALVVWYGAKLILEKGHLGGETFTVIVAVLTGSLSLGQASPCMTVFTTGRAAAYKMFETINRKPEIDPFDTRGKILNDISGDIELRDVDFSYPARPTEVIFSGFNLFIRRGTTTALVGQSGSGKSTVISLVERFYDLQGGESYDGNRRLIGIGFIFIHRKRDVQ